MRYLQHKSGQKLHIVFEINDGFTQPVCGRIFNRYRATFNVPFGNTCSACLQKVNKKSFNINQFIKSQL
jgi:hypothetical protein